MVYVLLSPAKTLDFKIRRTGVTATLPQFQARANQLVEELRQLSAQELGALMKLSDKLAALNVERFNMFQNLDEADDASAANSVIDPAAVDPAALQLDEREQYAPAVLAYRGDTYQGLNAPDLSDKDLHWAQDHLGILTGLYGVLRPLDMIQPYRLEMGTKLPVGEGDNLYQFWGETITNAINAHVAAQGITAVIGCASKEYLDAVKTDHLQVPFIQCDFKEKKDGALKIVGLFAKRARGMMARYVIENRITDVQQLKQFDFGGYQFEGALSTDHHFVFVR